MHSTVLSRLSHFMSFSKFSMLCIALPYFAFAALVRHSMGFTAPLEVDCVLLGMRQPQYVLGTVPLLFATPPVHSEVGLGMAWTDGAERGTGQMG